MKSSLFGLSLICTLFLAEAAWAQTIGGVIASTARDFITPAMALMWGCCMVVGVYLVGSGCLKAVQQVGRDEMPWREIVGRLMGGGALVSFPSMLGVAPTTFYGMFNPNYGVQASNATAGALAGGNCLTSSSGGLTCMAANFASNVVPTFMTVAWGMAMLWGAWLIVTGVHTLAVQNERGGTSQVKPIHRIVYGGLLMQLPYFIGAIATTLGYSDPVVGSSGFVANSVNLSYSPPGGVALLENYARLIGHIFVIMAMFGVIAVWKGISYLKAAAESGQQGLTSAGLTHIIGGALLVNAKVTTCFILNTVLGNGLNFC
jgi:hypothetical protein